MNKQDYILKISDFYGPIPSDKKESRLHRERIERLKVGYQEAASEAANLDIISDDPHTDIRKRLRLVKTATQYMDLRKKTNRLDVLQAAYCAGRIFALMWLHDAFFETGIPNDSPWKDWGRFHNRFVVPWAGEVDQWAKRDGNWVVHPPNILTTVRECLKNGHPSLKTEKAKPVPTKIVEPLKAQIVTVALSDVEGKAIQWFWPNRIPAGMLSLLVGNPGVGKSFLTMYICAMVSTGRDWPDDKNTQAPGSVLLFSDEESLEYAIKPRLQSHEADCTRIFAVPHIKRADGNPEPFTIDEHIQLLRETLGRMPDCRVIIFDPITAYLGAVNANNNAEVRGALVGLQGLAQERNVTILGINHFSKKAELDAIHRILGSTGFVAAARAVWAVVLEKQDEHADEDPARLLVPVKSNYSVNPTTLRFQIADGKVAFDPKQQRVNIDALMQQVKKTGGRQSNKKDAIADWLKERVGTEPVLVEDLKAESDEKEFFWRYVQTIANEMGIKKDKSPDHDGRYVWWREA